MIAGDVFSDLPNVMLMIAMRVIIILGDADTGIILIQNQTGSDSNIRLRRSNYENI
jgi:hypothetical protein